MLLFSRCLGAGGASKGHTGNDSDEQAALACAVRYEQAYSNTHADPSPHNICACCALFFLSLSADAYRMAVNEIKQSFDTIKYVDVVEKATKADLPGFSLDQSWMDNIVQKVSAQQEKLDQELARFKTNMIKESVRVSCEVPKEGVRCGGRGGVGARGVVRTSVVISRARRSINHPRA